MRLHHAIIVLCSSAVPTGCTAGEHERIFSSSQPEQREVGEIVDELGEKLWIVFQDKRNAHWFGSDGSGVYRVTGSEIVRYTTRDGLCNDHVRQILEDESGNIYVNTLGGISKFDGQRFSTLVASTSPGQWKLEPHDLWFKSTQDDDGPLRYDGVVLHRLVFPRHALEDEFRSKFPGVRYSPYGIYVVTKDSKGSVWFGTATFGACRYDGKSFTWISEPEMTELDYGPSFGVRGIVEDKDGKFWFSNTVHRYDVPATDANGRSPSAAKYRQELGINQGGTQEEADYATFVSAVKARDDAVWFAVYGAGVWRYDGLKLTHYPVVEDNKYVLLFSIFEDNAGVLWLGATESGAYRFNGKSFERFRP